MPRENKGKILVFSSREICYMSSNFFANQIGAAFEELGYETVICEIAKEDNLDEKLEPHIGESFQLILDFNSTLPRMVMEDDVPYLDKLNGPFFDYILDHPLFHYNCLSCKVRNMNVITLDCAQKDYVENYYPNVNKVFMLPLGATQALYQGEKKKNSGIFFSGTYDKPDQVYEIIQSSPQPLREMMEEILKRRIAEPNLPMEEALEQFLLEHGIKMSTEQFALYMNAMYAVDAYIRDYFREKALDELLDKKIPVTVLGEGWEKYHHVNEKYLTREKGIPFSLSFERIAREQVLLNVSPFFNRGMHDRIPAGMANRTVVLTDENPYLKECFADGKEMCFYSLANLSSLSEKAGELLENTQLREQIASQAREEFLLHHTWEKRAREILSFAQTL